MTAPIISLITVCYNSEATIAATLDSVASQSYRNIEHIVVDGGSIDGTLQILKSWSRSDLRIVSEPDDGVYDAMNKGIAMASGEIIGFLNADDMFADSSVVAQVATVMEDRSVDACFADLVYVDKDDVAKVVRYWKSREFATGAFAAGWCPAHPTFYVRKAVYDRLGSFDTSFRLAADAELMMRFLEKERIASVYVPRVWVRMRLGGKTNRNIQNIIAQNHEILTALDKHKLAVSRIGFAVHKIQARLTQRLTKPHDE